jgi:hypothetical protein
VAEEPYPDGVVGHAGRDDGDGEEQAERAGDDALLRPTIFLPVSVPWLVTGTFVEVLTVWVSMTAAVGSGARPSITRAIPVSS